MRQEVAFSSDLFFIFLLLKIMKFCLQKFEIKNESVDCEVYKKLFAKTYLHHSAQESIFVPTMTGVTGVTPTFDINWTTAAPGSMRLAEIKCTGCKKFKTRQQKLFFARADMNTPKHFAGCQSKEKEKEKKGDYQCRENRHRKQTSCVL